MNNKKTIACGMLDVEKDNKGLIPEGGLKPDLPIFPIINIKIGETLNSLPAESNPFKEQMDRIEEIKQSLQNPQINGSKTEIRLQSELERIQKELNETIPAYAEQNPDSLLATAYATDNPLSKFAQENPDLVMNAEEKKEFIQENNLNNTTNSNHNVGNALSNLIEGLKDKTKFSRLYGGLNRSDEMQKLTAIMDNAVNKDEATIIEMKNNEQLLLDPTKEGGLNIYGIENGKTTLIASFDESGKCLEGNAQKLLASLANNMEMDNDGVLTNLIDIQRDSIEKEDTKKTPKKTDNLLDVIKNNTDFGR